MRSQTSESGFTYVALLIAVAIIGMAAAAALQAGSVLQRREAEQALLVAGADFSAALDTYARLSPAGQPTAPPALADLLRDPRFPSIVRHLRRVPFDPMTGEAEWGLAKTPDGQRIAGVYSLSTARPIKLDGFDVRFRNFAGATSYADWVFMAAPTEPR
jgi:type II secretory pathway pseudopilin PulG